MKLYDLGFTLFILAIGVLFFSAGRSTCACGDLPPPDTIIEQVNGIHIP